VTEKAMGPGGSDAKARMAEEDDVHASSTVNHHKGKAESSTGSADALIPLIQADLKNAEKAGMPYYKAAGQKLLKAKGLLKHGDFYPWIKSNLKISPTTAFRYMKYADPNLSRGKDFKNMRDFRKRGLGEKPDPKPKHKPSDDDFSAFKKEVKGRAEERALEREMAKRIIAIGYKTMAQELHPDTGGTNAAMTHLNVARDRLKKAA
jgi:hypothetical protein